MENINNAQNTSSSEDNLLNIKDLHVEFHTDDGVLYAINNLNLSLAKGETLGLVGETGAGKTTTALAIMGLLADTAVASGTIEYKGQNLRSISEDDYLKIRGEEISMIFQDPMTALNPSMTIEEQIAECFIAHQGCNKNEAEQRAVEMLELVRIPAERSKEYPYQLSGGMKQRVVIAIALACNPSLILADEPTTALDVTIQAQVLAMMKELKDKFNTGMIMITHDFGIVAQMCDKVAVMYAGEIIESGSLKDIFKKPSHPYTVGLFKAIPNLKEDSEFLYQIDGLMPDPQDLPSGCVFHPRCEFAEEICKTEKPSDYVLEGDCHCVRCHRCAKQV